MLEIREATADDFHEIWPIFHEIAAAGQTYAYRCDTAYDEAMDLWMNQPRQTYVGLINGNIVGTYYIKTNQ